VGISASLNDSNQHTLELTAEKDVSLLIFDHCLKPMHFPEFGAYGAAG